MEKVKQALASLTKTEASRSALAAEIVEWIKPNHLTTDLISLFLNTRRLNAGDLLVKKLRRPGMRVRKFVPGTVHLADEIAVEDRVNYLLDGHVVKTMVNLWDLEAGDLGTLAEIKQEMTQKLTDFYVGRVFGLLATVWNATNTPYNYVEVAGDLTKAALDDAIDYITYRSGAVRSVVGVRNRLLPITDFAGYTTYNGQHAFSDPILTEALRSGWIGQYRGVTNILGIPQVWDNPADNNALIPENYVLVIGENAGEFITFGEPKWKEYTDMEPTPPYFVLEMYQQWSLLVDMAESIFVIKLT